MSIPEQPQQGNRGSCGGFLFVVIVGVFGGFLLGAGCGVVFTIHLCSGVGPAGGGDGLDGIEWAFLCFSIGGGILGAAIGSIVVIFVTTNAQTTTLPSDSPSGDGLPKPN